MIFPAKIEKTAQEKGGSLVLKKEPREIDGGFVLVYGGVEENCSAGALFASQRDELADKGTCDAVWITAGEGKEGLYV